MTTVYYRLADWHTQTQVSSLENKWVVDNSIHDLCSPWRGVKLQEGVLEGVVQLHDGGLVAAAVAVVGGGEDGDHVAVVGPVVALHHQLVGAGHQGQPVRVVESLGYILQTSHGQVLEKQKPN